MYRWMAQCTRPSATEIGEVVDLEQLLQRRSLGASARRVRQSWWKGVATRSLLLLHALGAGMKPASLQRCARACHTHSPYGTDAVIDSRALTRRSALELSYNGYIGLYKRWFIGVGHRACLGAMVCNETLRTKRESASCSAPLYGVFHVCSFGRHLARP